MRNEIAAYKEVASKAELVAHQQTAIADHARKYCAYVRDRLVAAKIGPYSALVPPVNTTENNPAARIPIMRSVIGDSVFEQALEDLRIEVERDPTRFAQWVHLVVNGRGIARFMVSQAALETFGTDDAMRVLVPEIARQLFSVYRRW